MLQLATTTATPSTFERSKDALGAMFTRSRIAFMFVVTSIMTWFFAGQSAFAQSDTINIDMTPFFENMNTYIPIFFGIFAIVGGIMAAMALSKLVINAVVSALSGRLSF